MDHGSKCDEDNAQVWKAVGKMIGEGQVEFKLRNGGEVETLSIEEVYNRVREEFERANLSL